MRILRNFAALYSWRYIPAMAELLRKKQYHATVFLRAFWTTNDFARRVKRPLPAPTRTMRKLVLGGSLLATLQVLSGLFLIDMWARGRSAGGLSFGVALIVAWPIVVPHVCGLLIILYRAVYGLAHPKAVGRAIVVRMLRAQVRRLRARHHFDVVAVVGSVGKTSTKMAIAHVLDATKRVRWQAGNYNDATTVPLVFFGETMPSLLNILGWLKVFLRNERAIRREFPFDFVVVELGTDKPGDVPSFAYVRPDLLVVTAIVPEHMEFFGTLEAVAAEELSAMRYSKQILLGLDSIPEAFMPPRADNLATFGQQADATYRLVKRTPQGLAGQRLKLEFGKLNFSAHVAMLGEQGAAVTLAALATARALGLTEQQLMRGVAEIRPVAGRMQILHGLKDTTILDDTYNSSPTSAKAALDVLCAAKAAHRIAILGSMNELGGYAPEAHREVGAHCDPHKLDLVCTIGEFERDYLAPAARERGCKVKSFKSPYEAGEYVRKKLKTDTIVLAKGSQNTVFAEESLKPLLAEPADAAQLVRQSTYWMRIKQRQFGAAPER